MNKIKMFVQIFGQGIDQGFDQGIDQGFREGKKHKYSYSATRPKEKTLKATQKTKTSKPPNSCPLNL